MKVCCNGCAYKIPTPHPGLALLSNDFCQCQKEASRSLGNNLALLIFRSSALCAAAPRECAEFKPAPAKSNTEESHVFDLAA